ncbi:transcription factor Opi1-domain-containing protein [Rhodocollybia butyracea]|uniref:Transcription factor Opi1-domain-containing protein n=1 Tax=Rhodocollybia butyracea TaxID=206335 RepID=A0A9P5UBQ2_9AGAR|nr:transcription factor Opi1-domain-containing protein [Rhodocollybia butyracea]
MRKLRYVLQWLQYATDHIDHQILTIRNFAESLQQQYSDPSTVEGSPTTPTRNNPSGRTSGHSRSPSASTHSRSSSETQLQGISEAHMHKLTSLRRDVVRTVRQVVGVVDKYGGSAALPEPARNAMKGFILMLPKKVGEAMRMGDVPVGTGPPTGPGSASSSVSGAEWDSVAAAASGRPGSGRRTTVRRRGDRGVGGSHSTTASPVPSRTASPSASPRIYQSRGSHSGTTSTSEDQTASGRGQSPPNTMSADTAVVAAQRILTLATESLNMMHGVTEVVRESLDRADAWIEKFRMVSVQRGNESSDAPAGRTSPNMDRGRMNFNLSSMQYRDHESDSALPSPLSTTLNLGSSRRGSVGSSAGYSYAGGSMPSTPGLSSYSYGYDGNPASRDAPEVGQGLRSMNIQCDEGETLVKNEDQEMVKMEVDA